MKSVTPEELGENKRLWKLVATDLIADKDTEYEFDAVMVCNGYVKVRWFIITLGGVRDVQI